MKIVITGLAATLPLGGVFWDYLQYPLGFHRLGHDVLYLEDTGGWCYDAEASDFVESGSRNADFLAQNIAQLEPELSDRWFFRDAVGQTYGRSWVDTARFCREADLFINVSAACRMRDEYFAAERVAYLDSDPMFTQASLPDYVSGVIEGDAQWRVEMMLRHDVFLTFGENWGRPDCLIPTEPIRWIPTRQPVVLDAFATAKVPIGSRRRVLTTVASWEHATTIVRGREYRGKGVEFERFLNLPRRSPLTCELALGGKYPREELLRLGWQLQPTGPVSKDPWVYRDYLATSFAEWSVAKHAYTASRSGWFSCRTACYLALGVPAIVQDTGFSASIPTGEGLLTFENEDEAVAAIEGVVHEPERHAVAAEAIAREYFDSSRVLTRLIQDCFDSEVGPKPAELENQRCG
jgi:Glycosyl transferases group 1